MTSFFLDFTRPSWINTGGWVQPRNWVFRKNPFRDQIRSSNRRIKDAGVSRKSIKRRERDGELVTLIDRFDKGFDVSFLTENKRLVVINGNPGGIISSIFKTPKSVEENLENKSPLPIDVVIQIRKYPTHPFLSVFVFLVQVYIERLDFWLFSLFSSFRSISVFSSSLNLLKSLITIAKPSQSANNKIFFNNNNINED